MYVLINFAMAAILIIAVNSNVNNPCANQAKFWLLTFAMILALNSLLQVLGIGMQYKSHTKRKAFEFSKLMQYLTSVAWLIYGNYLYFTQIGHGDNNFCAEGSAPLLRFTMLGTLVIGYIQLIMFTVLLCGLMGWLLHIITGWPKTEATPSSLWDEQQQFCIRDPNTYVSEDNKDLIRNLQEIKYQFYR